MQLASKSTFFFLLLKRFAFVAIRRERKLNAEREHNTRLFQTHKRFHYVILLLYPQAIFSLFYSFIFLPFMYSLLREPNAQYARLARLAFAFALFSFGTSSLLSLSRVGISTRLSVCMTRIF